MQMTPPRVTRRGDVHSLIAMERRNWARLRLGETTWSAEEFCRLLWIRFVGVLRRHYSNYKASSSGTY